MVLRPIQIWIIQWRHSIFLFLIGSIPFWENCSRKSKFSVQVWNLEPRLIRIFRIRWWFSFISFLDRKYFFWENLVTKFRIVSSSWNLLPRLFRMCRTEWWYSVFPILTENTSFGQIWSQNSKSFLQSKNWYLH